jgi:hypothetical protein
MGIDVLKSEYSYNGSAVLMLENTDDVDTLEIERQVEGVEGVTAPPCP